MRLCFAVVLLFLLAWPQAARGENEAPLQCQAAQTAFHKALGDFMEFERKPKHWSSKKKKADARRRVLLANLELDAYSEFQYCLRQEAVAIKQAWPESPPHQEATAQPPRE